MDCGKKPKGVLQMVTALKSEFQGSLLLLDSSQFLKQKFKHLKLKNIIFRIRTSKSKQYLMQYFFQLLRQDLLWYKHEFSSSRLIH